MITLGLLFGILSSASHPISQDLYGSRIQEAKEELNIETNCECVDSCMVDGQEGYCFCFYNGIRRCITKTELEKFAGYDYRILFRIGRD